jgi:4'-phosphopantetheinyl transferase EntD
MSSVSEMPNLLEIWKQLLPLNVIVEAGGLVDSNMLTPSELDSLGQTSDARRREFKAGRYYAKRALSKFGLRNVELPVGPDRLPAWPPGFVGSITHVQRSFAGQCAVAVARTSDVEAIGIDVEYDHGLHPRFWATILTPNELAQISKIPIAEREPETIRRWCIKEAIAKAVTESTEPDKIEIVVPLKQTTRYSFKSFSARTGVTLDPGRWRICSMRAQGLILATAVLAQQQFPIVCSKGMLG